ncbi:MAG: prenyltransferase [Chloroflexota bacterium]
MSGRLSLRPLLGTARVPFLILTPACVGLGAGTAHWTDGQISVLQVILVLIGAMCAHVGVNALNEYVDFRSELDFHTTRTPFSGGSGTLPRRPELARQALGLGLGSVVITALIGLYFVWIRGGALLPLGLLGLVVVVIYTPWLAQVPFLCLIAPGLGFGPLMVMGTDFALSGSYSWTAFVASLVPFFLVSDLLLLNQFPDAEPDREVGRRHYPIVIGRRRSSIIYAAFLLLTHISIVVGVSLGLLPLTSLLGLLTLVLVVPTARGAYVRADDMERLVPFLGLNVVINVATPLLVAIGLFVA